MSLLRDAADKLLAAWCAPRSEHVSEDPIGRVGTERGCSPDRERYHQAYDQLLWLVATAPREDLTDFAALFHEAPYANLPAPIQVTLFRLVGLEYPEDLEKLRFAEAGVSLYCSPGEAEGAVAGIKQRIQELESQQSD